MPAPCRRWLALAGTAALALAAAACGDDGGNAEKAEALGDSYEAFTTALASTLDISVAADDTKDRLTGNCDDLAGAVDNDGFDDLCGQLEDAVDDEDQAKFDAVKQQYAAFDDEVRATVQRQIIDAGGSFGEDGDDAGDNDDSNGGFDRNEPIPGAPPADD